MGRTTPSSSLFLTSLHSHHYKHRSVALNITSGRDNTFCPVDSGSASSGMSSTELTGLIVPIVCVALITILVVYCYYKRRMKQTVEKAKDLMEAQEVRHEQALEMNTLELPSTRSQLVFDLPTSDNDDGGGGISESQKLKKQNELLQKELKRRKQLEERAQLKTDGDGTSNISRHTSLQFDETDEL